MMIEPKHEAMLCIGGPHDGKRFASHRGAGFRVPVLPDRIILDGDSFTRGQLEGLLAEIETVQYRAETFRTPQGDVSFWVPEGQTPLETITLLLETYEAHKIGKDKR